MESRRKTTRYLLKFIILAAFFVFASAMIAVPRGVRSSTDKIDPVAAVPASFPRTGTRQQQRRYTVFRHDVKAHNIACGSCHAFPSSNWKKVRPENEAFPDITDYPKHASCINCHRQQFFRGAQPAICTICHTNPSPRNSTRHPFPNPREVFDNSPKGANASSDFVIAFPHEIHVEIVSRRSTEDTSFVRASWERSRRSEESCAVCHQTLMPQGDADEEFYSKPPDNLGDAFWLKKGTFKSSPIGHAGCFTCHSEDSGMSPAPTDCAVCHRPKDQIGPVDFDPQLAAKMGVRERVLLDAWRTRASSGTFRHEFVSHADMSCSSCHNVLTLVTNDQRTKRIAVTSCNMCHITETLDDGGILNYEIDERRKNSLFQCVKCHLTFGSRPTPESHIKAIAGSGSGGTR